MTFSSKRRFWSAWILALPLNSLDYWAERLFRKRLAVSWNPPEDLIPMKFCLVDRIQALVPGESIQTIKNVSLAEEYLQDHFPGFSVLPGVMMVECLVQSCAWLSRVTDDFRYSTILLKQARAVKFNNFLKPGQTLEVTAAFRGTDGQTAEFTASGTVEGVSAVSARLLLSRQNLADHNPALHDNDQRMVSAMKELFAQLRSV